MKKIGLIGCGNVGNSAIYAILNRGYVDEVVLVDLNKTVSHGHALDMTDAFGDGDIRAKIIAGDYNDLKDANVIYITAGRPQKSGETRLDMVADNAKIMKMIANSVKESGFQGITVISSNPCDVLTEVYREVTGFDSNKVISSGTSLETSRMKIVLSEAFKVPTSKVEINVLGEHGDSCVTAFSNGKIDNVSIEKIAQEKNIDLKNLHEKMFNRVYEIINSKGSTYFGIGGQTARIIASIIEDKKEIIPVGAYLQGQYNQENVYAGTPCKIGKNGIEEIIELNLNENEKNDFDKSCSILKEFIKKAHSSI